MWMDDEDRNEDNSFDGLVNTPMFLSVYQWVVHGYVVYMMRRSAYAYCAEDDT